MTRHFPFRKTSIGLSAFALTFGISMAAAFAASLHTAFQQTDNAGATKQGGSTADQQKNDARDRGLAQKIRQSINGEKSLSTDAHNVKVIVRNGHVPLKAGSDHVTSRLTMKS